MMKLSELKVLLSGHYIINAAFTMLYPILRSFHPFCDWLFPSEYCEMDWRDLELFSFLAIVLAVKNRKLKPVLFILFPEPAYKGPDNIRFFRGQALDEELLHNPDVTWIVEFYAPWSPPCVRLAPIFAEISLKYSCEYLKFGKLDVGKYPVVVKKHKIDTSVLSKQVPSLILYEGGKEAKRRPTVDSRSIVAPYSFTEEKILSDFNIEELYHKAKEREALKSKEKAIQDKKKD